MVSKWASRIILWKDTWNDLKASCLNSDWAEKHKVFWHQSEARRANQMQHGQHNQKPQQEGIDVSQNNVIYKATVTTASSTSTASTYIGMTEMTSKQDLTTRNWLFWKWNHSHDNIIKTQSVHLGTKGQQHGTWHQVANHQEGKHLQGKPLKLQFMPFPETLYFLLPAVLLS